MFAVYATHAEPDDPLAALMIGERPEPSVPEGWTRVKITHAALGAVILLFGAYHLLHGFGVLHHLGIYRLG